MGVLINGLLGGMPGVFTLADVGVPNNQWPEVNRPQKGRDFLLSGHPQQGPFFGTAIHIRY